MVQKLVRSEATELYRIWIKNTAALEKIVRNNKIQYHVIWLSWNLLFRHPFQMWSKFFFMLCNNGVGFQLNLKIFKKLVWSMRRKPLKLTHILPVLRCLWEYTWKIQNWHLSLDEEYERIKFLLSKDKI